MRKWKGGYKGGCPFLVYLLIIKSKYGKYRIIVFSIWCHIQPLTHTLLNSVVNQNGSILAYFDKPWKIKDLTKSKNLQQITPQNKLYYLTKNNFWC